MVNGAMHPEQQPQEHLVTATRPVKDSLSDEYKDLASKAEETESNDSFRLMESTNGTVALQKLPQHKHIVSLKKWNTAFNKYISILTESQPLLVPSLMQYMEHIRRLAQRAGDQTAFDRTFRKLGQCEPSLSFVKLHASTYTESICMGLSDRLSSRPFLSTKQNFLFAAITWKHEAVLLLISLYGENKEKFTKLQTERCLENYFCKYVKT
jgi:hypothetical protein